MTIWILLVLVVLGFGAWLFGPRLVAATMLYLNAIHAANVRFEPVPPALLPRSCAPIVDQLRSVGFAPISVVSVKRGPLPVVLVGLLADETRRMYARVSATSDRARPGLTLISPLHGGLLITSTTDEKNPLIPVVLHQGFPDASVVELIGKHTEAQWVLHRDGLSPVPTPAAQALSAYQWEWQQEAHTIAEMSGLALVRWALAAYGAETLTRGVGIAQRPDFAKRVETIKAGSQPK